MLTSARLRELVEYDPSTGIFTSRVSRGPTVRPGSKLGGVNSRRRNKNYIRMMLDGQKYLAHRLAWLWAYGAWPLDQIDHINGDKTDNRLSNLREATPVQNMANRRPRARASGLPGAHWDPKSKRWQGVVIWQGRRHYLGHYLTDAAAHEAFKQASRELKGEFTAWAEPEHNRQSPRTSFRPSGSTHLPLIAHGQQPWLPLGFGV